MSEAWTVTYLKVTFHDKIEEHINSLQNAPPIDAFEVQARFHEIKLLTAALRQLKDKAATGNPTELLKPACDQQGNAIDGYAVLEVAGWRGFYRVDHNAKTAVGMLIVHASDAPLRSLVSALNDAEKRK
jgi:hypothetical protein